ncbi:hypothetical protein HanIR_Chr06g0265531 [Helianthus annuus]|nr:hypothetical protein HanIR_Chr06g0265531 [Helianthus annuus]
MICACAYGFSKCRNQRSINSGSLKINLSNCTRSFNRICTFGVAFASDTNPNESNEVDKLQFPHLKMLRFMAYMCIM